MKTEAPKKVRPAKSASSRQTGKDQSQNVCPVCGAALVQEKCKVVCRSRTCVYRIIYNCSEF